MKILGIDWKQLWEKRRKDMYQHALILLVLCGLWMIAGLYDLGHHAYLLAKAADFEQAWPAEVGRMLIILTQMVWAATGWCIIRNLCDRRFYSRNTANKLMLMAMATIILPIVLRHLPGNEFRESSTRLLLSGMVFLGLFLELISYTMHLAIKMKEEQDLTI